MNVEYLLDFIINVGKGSVFFSFSNVDGKRWIMPAKNMRLAMNLYQPSGRKGKLLKALFPWLYKIQFIKKVVHAEKLTCRLNPDFELLLCNLFKRDNVEFAIFCGTPSSHQKITIQISKDDNILGYCKVTGSDEVTSLFQNEANLLNSLSKQGIECIPQSLYCGRLKEQVYIFVQTTRKTKKSKVVHQWTPFHEKFLYDLQRKTIREIKFEDSDYYKSVQNLLLHLDWLPKFADKEVIRTQINNTLNQYSGVIVKFSAYHADFTPWNMFVEKGKLFVFDWEYAQKTYPPFLDKYHYFTQTAIFESHWSEKEILKYIESADGKWIDKNTYCMYLLDIISRYTLREKGNIGKDLECCFRIWLKLLSVCETPCMFSSF